MNNSDNLNVNCPRCSVKITIDRNTTDYPRCEENIGEDVVGLYSRLDAIDNRNKPLKNIGKGTQSVGEEAQEWGCIFFMLPFAFFRYIDYISYVQRLLNQKYLPRKFSLSG